MATASRRRRTITGLAAAIGLGAGILTVAPAAEALSAPATLTPSGAVSSNTPTISWSKVTGAARYDVQVDDDSGFGSPEFTVTTTNSRTVPTSLLASGTQHVRVRAFTSSGTSSGWRSGEFTISQGAPPTPISPVGGQALAQPADPPLLTWNGVQGATSYVVELDTEDDFIGAKSWTTRTTSLVVPDPLPAATYWWRVQAVRGPGVVSRPSEPVSFQVGSLKPVTIVSPANNEDAQVEDVVLDWSAVPGAQYYQLQVATDQDFNTIVDSQTKVLGTSYSPRTTYDNNQYYWRVRAVDLAGEPTGWTSTEYNFNRVWPDRPEPVYPASSGVADSPQQVTNPDMYFQWTPVQHATDYQLDVGTDANFSPNTYASCQIAGTTYTPFAGEVNPEYGIPSAFQDLDCNPTPGNVMYWRVRPLDRPFTKSGPLYPGVQGLYSQTRSFVYDPAFFGADVSPKNGETVAVPTLSWTPLRGAERYAVAIKNASGSTVASETTYATSYTPAGGQPLDPSKGPYTWSLQALGAMGANSMIYTYTFNLSGAAPTTGAAPLTPLSGRLSDPATTVAPELSWEPEPGAHHYRLFARKTGATGWFPASYANYFGRDLPYPAVTDISPEFLSPGRYDWYVQAFSSTGLLLDTGPTSTFMISSLPAVTGQQIALDGSMLDNNAGCKSALANAQAKCEGVPSTPVLDWDPVPGATGYMVYLSEDGSFTNLVEPHNAIPYTLNTRWTPTASAERESLPDSQAGQAYYWFVRPCKTGKVCGPDPEGSSGMATNAFRKASPGVSSSAPGVIDGANAVPPPVATNDITFTWADYFTTNQAHVWSTTGERSPQAAMQYRIQVDDTATFSGTLVDDQKVDQTTYTAYEKLYPEGTLYWRVQAIDAEGNGLTWSPVRTFKKETPGPALQSPTGGTTVAGTTPFRWQAQPFAASYRIEVYRNNDTTFSSANRVFYMDVKTAAYAWDSPLPASSSAYVWRVRRTDPSNNPGPWSSAGRFYSRGAIPALRAPSAGVYVAANGPLFTWSEVPGASSYDLQVRQDGASYDSIRVTTAATAWATTSALTTANWEWRVTAKDAGNNVLGTAAWRSFKVDATAPTVTSYSPTSSAWPAGNFIAKFSERVKGVSSTTMRLYVAGRTTPLLAKVTLSTDGRTATLNPNSNLTSGKIYTVKLTSGIKDVRGNSLVATQWSVSAK